MTDDYGDVVQLKVRVDQDITSLCDELMLLMSAIFDRKYPGKENHVRWAAAMNLLALQLQTQVIGNEIAASDDLGLEDLSVLDERANRLRQLLTTP
jgi:hypothetical protein